MVLHEIAHIVDGHTFADDLAWSNVNKTKTIEVEDQPFPHWGAEVFADRWALKKLGANLVEQSETRTIVAGLAVASFAGAIFALLLKYGSAHLRNIPHTIQQQLHPPFWFRCHEIIANTTRAGREFEAHRDLLFACLDGISRCDPLFGTLLHPIRDGEAAVAATALSSESLAELQCWKDQR